MCEASFADSVPRSIDFDRTLVEAERRFSFAERANKQIKSTSPPRGFLSLVFPLVTSIRRLGFPSISVVFRVSLSLSAPLEDARIAMLSVAVIVRFDLRSARGCRASIRQRNALHSDGADGRVSTAVKDAPRVAENDAFHDPLPGHFLSRPLSRSPARLFCP